MVLLFEQKCRNLLHPSLSQYVVKAKEFGLAVQLVVLLSKDFLYVLGAQWYWKHRTEMIDFRLIENVRSRWVALSNKRNNGKKEYRIAQTSYHFKSIVTELSRLILWKSRHTITSNPCFSRRELVEASPATTSHYNSSLSNQTPTWTLVPTYPAFRTTILLRISVFSPKKCPPGIIAAPYPSRQHCGKGGERRKGRHRHQPCLG